MRADPSSGVSVKPVAASSLASAAVPSPTLAGGASVAAANADTLASSQVHTPCTSQRHRTKVPRSAELCCHAARRRPMQVPRPTIAGGTSVAAANADILASRRVRTS